jgi:predicted 3-demethylubiquinone-9 3-methyltransferase (glyoxalase superfamily)
MQHITPFIWFESKAEEAMNFYVTTFKNSKIIDIERYAGDQGIPGEDKLKGKVLNGTFELNGQRFMCLDGGPQFPMSGAISFMVEFDTQEELDAVWDKLVDGGKPMQCGWVTDKFGVTWQIVPASFGRMMSDPSATPQQKQALMQAMMPMVKMDAATLEAAFENAK